jgi:hypothetical protein
VCQAGADKKQLEVFGRVLIKMVHDRRVVSSLRRLPLCVYSFLHHGKEPRVSNADFETVFGSAASINLQSCLLADQKHLSDVLCLSFDGLKEGGDKVCRVPLFLIHSRLLPDSCDPRELLRVHSSKAAARTVRLPPQ